MSVVLLSMTNSSSAGPVMLVPVGILGDGHGNRQPVPAGQDRGVPAAPGDGVALAHQEAVTGIGCGGGIVASAEGAVYTAERTGERKFGATIVDVEKEPAITPGSVHGPEEVDIH